MVDLSNIQRGDVVFSRGHGFVDSAIRHCECRRYPKDSVYVWSNHVAMVTQSDGTIAEAQSQGMAFSSLTRYTDDFAVYRPDWHDLDQANLAATHIERLVAEKARYDYLQILCQALAFETGTKFRFGTSGKYICSGAGSFAIISSGYDLTAPSIVINGRTIPAVGDDPEFNSPADVLRVAVYRHWLWVAGTKLSLT